MEIKTKMTGGKPGRLEHILAGRCCLRKSGLYTSCRLTDAEGAQDFADHEIQPNVIVDFLYVRYKKADIANLIAIYDRWRRGPTWWTRIR